MFRSSPTTSPTCAPPATSANVRNFRTCSTSTCAASARSTSDFKGKRPAGRRRLRSGRSRPRARPRIMTQGSLSPTGKDFDLAIRGEGFFKIQMPDGTFAYTRDGSFEPDSQGRIVNAQGYVVQPAITVPNNAQSISTNNPAARSGGRSRSPARRRRRYSARSR